MRKKLGWWLRCLADRIDRDHADLMMGHSFTFEEKRGIVFHDDGRGCPLRYNAADYDLAFAESGTLEYVAGQETTRLWEGTQ